ncbi:hypothetical protein [Rhodoplanes sp. Z2-YC6860]|uniref:hypothetical protein n=1 Tax=Rhodoplanes sp. Z2-YC6860 TaxID=674703 RepID=UPI0012ED0997|nr:hypothetical protein [Rhodoplanes sp. Z2-YC6860]
MNTIQILFLTAIAFGILKVVAGYCQEREGIPPLLSSIQEGFFNVLRWSIPAASVLYVLSEHLQIREYMYFVVPAIVAIVEVVRHARPNSSWYGHAR